MPRRARLAAPFALLLALPAFGQASAPAAAERVEKDTPRTTPAGTTFTVPAGWTMTTKTALVVLDPLETDSHIAIVDVQAKDAEAAVAAAWAAYQPGFKRPLRLSVPQAARNGWEERKTYQYETSPNERAVVTAMAHRAGEAWTVALLDGSEPTVEKRGAPIALVIQSLRPKGYTRESFAGRRAHPLDEKRLATKYVEMELAKGRLPGGGRLVSEKNLLARYQPNVMVDEDVTYGMALMVDTRFGVQVVRHGGDLAGYHSDMIWLPEHGVGAVILTNGDSGVFLRGPLLRRMLEVLFDGKPEAQPQLEAAAAQRQAAIAKERERLVVPPSPAETARLAPRYVNQALGEVKVLQLGPATVFDVGEWKSAVASRKNDDGTISFITIDATLSGFEFVVADKDGQRRLVTRDGQHEYVFTAP